MPAWFTILAKVANASGNYAPNASKEPANTWTKSPNNGTPLCAGFRIFCEKIRSFGIVLCSWRGACRRLIENFVDREL